MVEELSERAEKIRGGGVDPHEDNMLKITNDGKKLALDQRLINDLLPDEENGKVSTCANNMMLNNEMSIKGSEMSMGKQ